MTLKSNISDVNESELKNQELFPQIEPFRYAELSPGWLQFQDLLIHIKLFEQWGLIVATSAADHNPVLQQVTTDSFPLGKLTFEIKETTATPRYLSTAELLTKLNAKSAPAVLDEKRETENRVISNTKEGVFLPFSLMPAHTEKEALPDDILYMDFWSSSEEAPANIDFTGFRYFVTAECLFGASLKANDGEDNEWAIIKHKHRYYTGQIIRHIIHIPAEANAYETSLGIERKRIIRLMNAIKNPEIPEVGCLDHIPGHDYILFGMSLFLKNRITLNALKQFFIETQKKQKTRAEEITKDFRDSGIQKEIASPFDELFSAISALPELTAENVLTFFEIPAEEIEPEKDNKKFRGHEKKFVKHCLDFLSCHGEYSQIWTDFIEASDRRVHTLEDLFKLANAVMIARRAFNQKPYEVCSILPATEKQIQVEYQKISNRFVELHPELSNRYPPVFNITILDPVLAYNNNLASNNNAQGNLFYFQHGKAALTRLIASEPFRKAAAHNRVCSFYRNHLSAPDASSMIPDTLEETLSHFTLSG